jgi:hypothetical protein
MPRASSQYNEFFLILYILLLLDVIRPTIRTIDIALVFYGFAISEVFATFPTVIIQFFHF